MLLLLLLLLHCNERNRMRFGDEDASGLICWEETTRQTLDTLEACHLSDGLGAM